MNYYIGMEKAETESYSVYNSTKVKIGEIIAIRKRQDPSYNKSDSLRESTDCYLKELKEKKQK